MVRAQAALKPVVVPGMPPLHDPYSWVTFCVFHVFDPFSIVFFFFFWSLLSVKQRLQYKTDCSILSLFMAG